MRAEMARHLSVPEYLAGLGPSRPSGLVFGHKRPAPSTKCPGGALILQRLAGVVTRQLGRRFHDAGVVVRAPVDVVLDAKNALVLHPWLAVLLRDRLSMRRAEAIWGAPNLIVELIWPATARRTRCSKLAWYRNYGVEECWLVDTRLRRVEVFDFSRSGRPVPEIYSDDAPIQSRFLGSMRLNAVALFRGIKPYSRRGSIARLSARPGESC